MNSTIVGVYLYALAAVFVFIYNCRSWVYVRVTVLYFLFLTIFACLLMYGSAFNLESHLDEWHREGFLNVMPIHFTNAYPNDKTIPRTDPNYFPWLLATLCFFVTFPQSVNRSAAILHKDKSTLALLSKLFNDFITVGEWIFVLVALLSLAPPFLAHNWILMLIGCFFIMLLTGADIAGDANGIPFLLLRVFRPAINLAVQRVAARLLKVAVFLICAVIALLCFAIFYSLMTAILHTKDPGEVAFILDVLVFIGALWLSYKLLHKWIRALILKVVGWMAIEVMDTAAVTNGSTGASHSQALHR